MLEVYKSNQNLNCFLNIFGITVESIQVLFKCTYTAIAINRNFEENFSILTDSQTIKMMIISFSVILSQNNGPLKAQCTVCPLLLYPRFFGWRRCLFVQKFMFEGIS